MFLHKGQLGAPYVALGEVREDPLAIASYKLSGMKKKCHRAWQGGNLRFAGRAATFCSEGVPYIVHAEGTGKLENQE